MKKKLAILGVIILVVVGLYQFFDLGSVLSLESLKENKDVLRAQVDANPVLFIGIFALVYFVVVALSLPVATVFSLAAGFLFGSIIGTLIVVTVATSGAVAVFLLARKFFGEQLQEKYGDKMMKLTREIEENGFNHLLFLRFVPLFPFFLVNIAPAFTKMKVRTFALATFIGIIPGSFAFVNAGRGLGDIDTVGDILSPGVISSFVLLGVIALIPALWKKFGKKKEAMSSDAQESIIPEDPVQNI